MGFPSAFLGFRGGLKLAFVAGRFKPLGAGAPRAGKSALTLASRVALSIGLIQKSAAPSRRPSWRSLRTVQKTTGTFSRRGSSRSLTIRSKPSPSGSRRSSTTRSGRSFCASRRPCSAVAAACTKQPSLAEHRARPLHPGGVVVDEDDPRGGGGGHQGGAFGGDRQQEAEGGAFAGPAFDLDPAVVKVEDLLDDGEPQAHAAVLALGAGVDLVEAVEDLALQLGRNADAVVAHQDLDAGAGLARASSTREPGGENLTALVSRFSSTWEIRLGSP